MPPVGFKPTISAGERPQTYALDRAAAGTGNLAGYCEIIELAANVSNSDISDVWYSHSSFIVSSPLDS